MQVLEDFVPQELQDKILLEFTSGGFPWYYESATADITDQQSIENRHIIITELSKESPQFKHTLYWQEQSRYFYLVDQLLQFAQERLQKKVVALGRVKTNFITKDSSFPEGYYNTPHIDMTEGYQTLLYYVNDSDGDTVLFDQCFPSLNSLTVLHKQVPQKGTAILFDSNRWHCSSPPRLHNSRIVINCVLKLEP